MDTYAYENPMSIHKRKAEDCKKSIFCKTNTKRHTTVCRMPFVYEYLK